MKKFKTQKAITLVALVITIIVLLILAVVAIGAVRDSGIIGHAQNSADKYNTEKAKEESLLGQYEDEISKYYSSNGSGGASNKKYYDITFKDLTKIADWETLIPKSNDLSYMLWFTDKDGNIGCVQVISYGYPDGYRIEYIPEANFNADFTYYYYTHEDTSNNGTENHMWFLKYPDIAKEETSAPVIKNVSFMTDDEVQEYLEKTIEFDKDEEMDENFQFKGNMYFDFTEEQKSQILNITEASNVDLDGDEEIVIDPEVQQREVLELQRIVDDAWKNVSEGDYETWGMNFISSLENSEYKFIVLLKELDLIVESNSGLFYEVPYLDNPQTVKVCTRTPGEAFEKYEFFNANERVSISGCKTSLPSNLVIPDTVFGESIEGIVNEAFHNKNIKSVTIPSTISYTEDEPVFKGCSNLTKITFLGRTSLSDMDYDASRLSGWVEDTNNWQSKVENGNLIYYK